jgi:hypothetical protein
VAYVAAGAIQTRVREVIEGASASLRSITPGAYLGDLAEGDSDMDRARAVVSGARVEALCTGMDRSPSSPPIIGNVALYDMRWRVRVVRLLSRTAQIDDATRDAVKALAFQDADVLAQALGFPGNLATTTAGTATGIISGLMTYTGSSSSVRGPIDTGASILETDHSFTAIVRSTPAVS